MPSCKERGQIYNDDHMLWFKDIYMIICCLEDSDWETSPQ